MRIIDKNTDFYDYYQNIYKDDTFTFDRRESFILTKEIMCQHLSRCGWRHWRSADRDYVHGLLQIGITYWLFVFNIKERNNFDNVIDYDIELIETWKNSNKPRKLCNFDLMLLYSTRTPVSDVKNDFYIRKINVSHHSLYQGDIKVEKNIPLLKACGIAKLVDPLSIYLAFEEYFSLEKTASERRDPLGITDIDKVESHGFDKKTSFRGK